MTNAKTKGMKFNVRRKVREQTWEKLRRGERRLDRKGRSIVGRTRGKWQALLIYRRSNAWQMASVADFRVLEGFWWGGRGLIGVGRRKGTWREKKGSMECVRIEI